MLALQNKVKGQIQYFYFWMLMKCQSHANGHCPLVRRDLRHHDPDLLLSALWQGLSQTDIGLETLWILQKEAVSGSKVGKSDDVLVV